MPGRARANTAAKEKVSTLELENGARARHRTAGSTGSRGGSPGNCVELVVTSVEMNRDSAYIATNKKA